MYIKFCNRKTYKHEIMLTLNKDSIFRLYCKRISKKVIGKYGRQCIRLEKSNKLQQEILYKYIYEHKNIRKIK